MVNAKIREGKIRLGFEVDPTVYTRWQDSGMNQSYVFEAGLDIPQLRARIAEIQNLLQMANDEIMRKNERLYTAGKTIFELNEKLTATQKELEAAKEMLTASGISYIKDIPKQNETGGN